MRSATTILIATTLTACGGSSITPPPPPPPPSATIVVSGRTERGLTVPLRLISSSSPVTGAVFSVLPAAAAILYDGDSIHFNIDGPITISARGAVGGDSVQGSLALTVSVPPTIVFDAIAAGNRDIWSVQLDGGALTRLTTNAGDDREPTSRGGSVIFISYRGGAAALYRVPLTGGADAPLSTTATAEADPALSADAAQVAFAQGTGFPRIMIATANGASVSRLAAADGGWSGTIEGGPAWSPSGDRIAYMTTRDGAAGIYFAAVNGASGSATQLVSGAHGYASVEPAWSPDGLSIAFASNRDGPTDLYLITVASGAVRRLTTRGNLGEPTFTADGRVVFSEFSGGAFALRWLDPADTSRVHVIPTGAGSAQHPSEAR